MANTRFSYVKQFEQDSAMLPGCWPLVRIDGRSFTEFSKRHGFKKPSDPLALGVMNAAAAHVMSTFQDIVLAYGHSDEFSFLLKKDTRLYNRRSQKILSCIVSTFSSAYCLHWKEFFPGKPLQLLPTFDGRIVLYPSFDHVVDYFSWRHADCHINTQYNICFWCLVADGKTSDEAYKWLKHTNKGDKNEYIFKSRGINYNNLPQIFRKGSTLVRLSPEEHGSDTDLAQDLGASRDGCLDTTPSDGCSDDLIALTIDEGEMSRIYRKIDYICKGFHVGFICCDNICADFWKIVSPSYGFKVRNNSVDAIASLTQKEITLLNCLK